MVKYCERVRKLYDSLQYLAPPLLKNQEYLEADWETLDKNPLEYNICRSICADGLPLVMQDELDHKETDYRVMTPEELFSALDDIEQANICCRQMKEQVWTSEKATHAAKRASADSSDDNTGSNKRRKKSKDSKSKSSRMTVQGIARYCQLCKDAGMPHAKYSSHNTNQCKDATEMKAKLSGGSKDRSEATHTWKKEQKALLKEVKLLKKANKQLMNIALHKSSKKKKKSKASSPVKLQSLSSKQGWRQKQQQQR